MTQEGSSLLAAANLAIESILPEITAAVSNECEGLDFFIVDGPASVRAVDIRAVHVFETYLTNVSEDSISFSADANVSFSVFVQYHETLSYGESQSWRPHVFRRQHSYHDDNVGPLWASHTFRVAGTALWYPGTSAKAHLSELFFEDPQAVAVPVFDYEES